jgi:hypothetical protein
VTRTRDRLNPTTVLARARERQNGNPRPTKGPDPLLVVGAALVAGIALAKLISLRGRDGDAED